MQVDTKALCETIFLKGYKNVGNYFMNFRNVIKMLQTSLKLIYLFVFFFQKYDYLYFCPTCYVYYINIKMFTFFV